jgi:hypothetical protein
MYLDLRPARRRVDVGTRELAAIAIVSRRDSQGDLSLYDPNLRRVRWVQTRVMSISLRRTDSEMGSCQLT